MRITDRAIETSFVKSDNSKRGFDLSEESLESDVVEVKHFIVEFVTEVGFGSVNDDEVFVEFGVVSVTVQFSILEFGGHEASG